MLDMSEVISEARRLSALIDRGVEALRNSADELAAAENAYRLAKAKAWVMVQADDALAKHKEAHVDGITADLRMARDIAEGQRQAALEALRSRRIQLSALQSVLAATRSEMEMAR